MKDSKIQWTDHTFNPWIGCTKVSDLCKNCYAEVQTFARVQRGKGRELWGPTADRHRTSVSNWNQPRKWNAEAAAEGVRRRVFCASLSDVFEDRRDLDPWRSDLWTLIEQTPALDWLLLTKRPQNVCRLAPEDVLRRCWVGYSGTDLGGMSALLDVPAAVRFLSIEPILAPVDLTREIDWHDGPLSVLAGVQWVIVGGESGHGARPCDVAWVRSIVEQCKAARVPVFVKQMGSSWVADMNAAVRGMRAPHMALMDSKGGDPAEWPEDLRVRELPA